jgi:transglutaminase-like putative cysteine protease
LITFEVQKHAIVEPANPQTMKAPRNPPPEVRPYLLPSPYIESRDLRIRALAKQIANGPAAPWQHVEAIFDWVRENIEYQEGSLKGAVTALRDGNGDCEELTSLFIALCRASNIPARTVWVPGHCYPEFYLQDEQGRGQWLPCQVAGQRDFGRIFETRPILQKGDNFRIPEDPRPQRYVQIVKSLPGRGFVHPQVKVIQQPLSGHGRNRSEAGANRN